MRSLSKRQCVVSVFLAAVLIRVEVAGRRNAPLLAPSPAGLTLAPTPNTTQSPQEDIIGAASGSWMNVPGTNDPSFEPTEDAFSSQSLTPAWTDGRGEATSVPTTAPTLPAYDCYNNLTILAAHMRAKLLSESKTYVICPNTVYEVGSPSWESKAPYLCNSGLHSPLFPRSDTRILCGENGRSENQCVLRGGDFQVNFYFPSYWEQVTSAEIWGVTFEDSGAGAVLLGNGGHITFRDCIFRNHTRQATIISNFNYGQGQERLLLSADLLPNQHYITTSTRGAEEEEEKRLAAATDETEEQLETVRDRRSLGKDDPREYADWKRQQSTFLDCLFENNAKSHLEGVTSIHGVITILEMNDDMTIINSTFIGNWFGNPEDQEGYAISVSEGSTLDLRNNCFINNRFIGDGMIRLHNEKDLRCITNNFVTPDDGLNCQFVSILSASESSPICIDADARECKSPEAVPIFPVIHLFSGGFNHTSSASGGTRSIAALAFTAIVLHLGLSASLRNL